MNKTKVYIAETNVLQNDDLFNKLYCAVSPLRREKTDRIALRNDKNLSLGAEALLKFALKSEGITHYEIEYCETGKPYLKNTNNVFFNLSHSGERVMCVISGWEVGCDTEKTRDVTSGIAERFFCEKECVQILNSKTEEEKKNTFFRLWTLKESFMKMTGLGLKLGLNSFSFDISDETVKCRQSYDNESCYFREFDFDDGYKYAVCSKTPNIEDAIIVDFGTILT